MSINHPATDAGNSAFRNREEVEAFFARGDVVESYYAGGEAAESRIGRMSATINAWSAFGLVCCGIGMGLGAIAHALIIG